MENRLVKAIAKNEDGKIIVSYYEIDLVVDITDLRAAREKEIAELFKGKDWKNPSIADQIAQNKILAKYDELQDAREKQELARHSLGMSWETFRSEKSISSLSQMIENNIKGLNSRDQEKAYRTAKLFLLECRRLEDEKLRERAGYLLDELKQLIEQYYRIKTEQEKREQINKVKANEPDDFLNGTHSVEPIVWSIFQQYVSKQSDDVLMKTTPLKDCFYPVVSYCQDLDNHYLYLKDAFPEDITEWIEDRKQELTIQLTARKTAFKKGEQYKRTMTGKVQGSETEENPLGERITINIPNPSEGLRVYYRLMNTVQISFLDRYLEAKKEAAHNRLTNCTTDVLRTDLSELCEDCELRILIPDAIEKEEIPVMESNRETMTGGQFKEWIKEQIEKAAKNMQLMRIEAKRPGAYLHNITDTYLFNKERAKALKRYLEPTEEPKRITAPEYALYYFYLAETGHYPQLTTEPGKAYDQITSSLKGIESSTFGKEYRKIKNITDRLNKPNNDKRIEKILPKLKDYPKALQMAENELNEIRNRTKQK